MNKIYLNIRIYKAELPFFFFFLNTPQYQYSVTVLVLFVGPHLNQPQGSIVEWIQYKWMFDSLKQPLNLPEMKTMLKWKHRTQRKRFRACNTERVLWLNLSSNIRSSITCLNFKKSKSFIFCSSFCSIGHHFWYFGVCFFFFFPSQLPARFCLVLLGLTGI